MDEVRYQVFVSSTYNDLQEERAKVLQAILQLGAFPAGMELFPAADSEQFEYIRREIDSSDYYVVIIGGKYGQVSSDGLSFTEKEYDYAREIGKPILAFVVKDAGKLIGDKLETSDERRKKLAAFTSKAKASKLVKFFSNPDELMSAVLASLPSQFRLTPKRGWVRAGSTPRADLERITLLQDRILQLEQENSELRKRADEPEQILANGDDPASWNLNLDTFVIGNSWPGTRQIQFNTTWNDLLNAIFGEGSSGVAESNVKITIMKLISKDPAFDAPPEWHNQFASFQKNPNWIPESKPVQAVLKDIHRQFSGLELITDAQETIYVPQMHGAQPNPKTMSIWKLSEKGKKQLAFSQGFRKPVVE